MEHSKSESGVYIAGGAARARRRFAFLAVLTAAAAGGELRGQELKDLSIEQLLNLEVVTASRFPQPLTEAPATIFVLTEHDIRVLGAASVPDLLRTVPGLDVMTAWDTEIEVGVRGLNTRQNAKLLVLLDGHRVNNDFSGAVRWKELPVLLEDIERVEVSLTPNSSLYGANAFAGIIQIFTKPAAARRGWRLGAQAGNKDDRAYSASYGWAIGKLDFALAAATGKTEGWGNRDPDKYREYVLPSGSNVDAKIKDWSELSRITLRADLPAGTDHRLSLRGGIVSGVLASPDLSSLPGKMANNPMPTLNGYASLDYEREFTDRAGLETRIGYSYWHDKGSIQQFMNRRYDGEARYWRRLGERLRLTAGLAGETSMAESAHFTRSHVRDGLYAGYGQLDLRPLGRLNLMGGFRYDKNLNMDGVFSPRAAAVFALAEGHSLRYGAGSAFRKPSFMETYLQSMGQMEYPGGRRLPERITYQDMSYQGLLSESVSLRFGLFRYKVKDLIILHKLSSTIYQYEGLQRLDIRGAETELRWALSGAFQAFGNVSYQDLDYRSPIDTQRLSVPEIKWNLGLTCETAHGLAGSLVVRHVGAKKAEFGQFVGGSNRFMEIGDYTTLDAKLAYSVPVGRGTLEFGLTVLNLLDEKHMEYPVIDSAQSYFSVWSEEQKSGFENRNALNDRRILAHVAWRF